MRRRFHAPLPRTRPAAAASALSFALSFALSLFCAATAAGQSQPRRRQSPSATEDSYARARRVLNAGLGAHGGLARLRAADKVTIKYRATGHPPGQNFSFAGPPINVPRVGARTLIDYSGNRYVTEGRSDFPTGGYQFNFRQVVAPRRSFSIDLLRNRRGHTVQSLSAQQQTSVKLGLLYEAPHVLLLYANDRAETLRWLGTSRAGGSAHDVIGFSSEDGAQVSLYFDARTRLLARYETLSSNPLLGDVTGGANYSGYRQLGGVLVPGRRTNTFAGRVTGVSDYAEVSLDFAAEEGLLEVPAGYVEATPPAGEAAEPLRRMGDGVYLLQRLGYRVMFVEFRDHVMVLETPTDANVSQLAINRIKQTAPGKPIRYVSFSHFHFDHTGGLRQYIAEGATVVVPPGNRPFVEAIARSKFTVRPDALALKPAAPKIETFTGRRVFTDGERTVELHSIGPTAHADEMAIFYFPKEKILFQGDMFSQLEAGGIPPAVIEVNRELVRKVEALGLRVETLVGVHAGAVPWQTFRDAVARQPR